MNFPADLKYARSDEWIRVEGDTATVGVTDYAQSELSDVVYVDMPAVGDAFEAGQSFGSVESVKAASEIYLPVAGAITAVNDPPAAGDLIGDLLHPVDRIMHGELDELCAAAHHHRSGLVGALGALGPLAQEDVDRAHDGAPLLVDDAHAHRRNQRRGKRNTHRTERHGNIERPAGDPGSFQTAHGR